MNLADAIRAAATDDPQPQASKPKAEANPKPPPSESPASIEGQKAGEVEVPKPPFGWSPDIEGAAVSGNVVRLEIFMSPEQMSGMLKAIMAGQHSVMTLREAAAYLRVSVSTLEKLANEGEIPAVEIEGRWRFPRTHLDDWLATKSATEEEEEEDVA